MTTATRLEINKNGVGCPRAHPPPHASDVTCCVVAWISLGPRHHSLASVSPGTTKVRKNPQPTKSQAGWGQEWKILLLTKIMSERKCLSVVLGRLVNFKLDDFTHFLQRARRNEPNATAIHSRRDVVHSCHIFFLGFPTSRDAPMCLH